MKNDENKLINSSDSWGQSVDNVLTAANIGGATFSGAKSGAVIGSALLPGLGTAAGGFIGGVIGGATAIATKWDTVKKWWPW
ncbi:MAG: hypothetical protein ACQBVK_04760 [Candidatus Phytoplasma sp. TWB_XP]